MIYDVPMFEPRMRPGCLETVIVLGNGVGDRKRQFCAEFQQEPSIVVAVYNTMFPRTPFQAFVSQPNLA